MLKLNRTNYIGQNKTNILLSLREMVILICRNLKTIKAYRCFNLDSYISVQRIIYPMLVSNGLTLQKRNEWLNLQSSLNFGRVKLKGTELRVAVPTDD